MSNILVPRMKPVAPYTWELRAVLSRTALESGRIPIEFPGPSVVVGAYVSVIKDSAVGGLLVPNADDILALVDVDNRTFFTSGPTQGQSSSTSQSSQYVTLASLDTRNRDVVWDLKSPRPVMGISFRWKRFTGVALYEDALCAISLFVTDREGVV